jgi:hypothetical protein
MANKNSFVHYISYKKNPREMELYLYIEKKSCKSAWMKEACEEKMERETKNSQNTVQNNTSNVIPNIPTFNDSFM